MTAEPTGSRHPTPEQRAARGKAARSEVPRSAHGRFVRGERKRDPTAILQAQSAGRLQDLVPIRYGRMLESPFRFYRGAAAIMAADLGQQPRTRLITQLCGDAHLLNFGLFASPERHLVFDVNDFDETHPGPFEWDLKRLAASFAVAGRANGFGSGARAAVVREAVGTYRERMHHFAGLPVLDIWYAQDDTDDLRRLLPGSAEKGLRKKAARAVAKARTKDSMQAFGKLTHVVDGQRRIAANPPLVVPLRDLLDGTEREGTERDLRLLMDQYGESLSSDRRHLLRRFSVADMARKVVGVGSVGTRCWIILLLGRDGEDPLLLQAKEAGESVLAPCTGPGVYRNQGHRVVAGQKLMQAASDIFLGWERVTGIDGEQRDFYVRQLRDWKGSSRPETMSEAEMQFYARMCGGALARGHARSGDPVAIAAYLGGGDAFDRALGEFAEVYADQNERDYDAFAKAAATGRISVETA